MTTWRIEDIKTSELRSLDLRAEAAESNNASGVRLDPEVVAEYLADIDAMASEPFAQVPALAWRLWIDAREIPAEVLVLTDEARIAIADGADAEWGDMRDPCDLTTEAGGESFAAARDAAIRDWLNDAEAWEARR